MWENVAETLQEPDRLDHCQINLANAGVNAAGGEPQFVVV